MNDQTHCNLCADVMWRAELRADINLEEALAAAGATCEIEWDDNVRTYSRDGRDIIVTITDADRLPSGWNFALLSAGHDTTELDVRFCQLDQVIDQLTDHLAGCPSRLTIVFPASPG